MAAIGSIDVDVQANLPESVQRLRALELAVEARTPGMLIVEEAGKYLAFLKGDSSRCCGAGQACSRDDCTGVPGADQ